MIEQLPAQFLNYFLVPKPDGSGNDKIPCSPSGVAVDAHDPRNWLTYQAAVATGRPVAFSLTDACGWFFFDLDKCSDGQGGWKPEAAAIFTSFAGAYGEVSSSGHGLHIMGRCDPARLADRRRKWDGWLECYTGGRFVAFGGTGWQPIGGVATNTDMTERLLAVVPAKPILGDLAEGVDPSYTGPADDAALLMMALRSGSAGAAFNMKASFKDLWEAKPEVMCRFYPGASPTEFDHSVADAALMAHLAFWTGKDLPRMDRLFRQSGLMRDKYATRDDYRTDTATNAARLCRKVYDQPPPPPPAAGTAGPAAGATRHEVYLTISEMLSHFAGCVYVRDLHKIIIPGGKALKPEQFNASFGGHMFQMQPDGTKPTAKAFEAFTENRAHTFPKVSEPTFDPQQPGGTIIGDAVNTYYPPNVDMTPGDVSPFLVLLEKLLPDARDRAILTNYMAAVVQHPGVKFQWAPVLQGCEGNGKTLVFSTVSYAVGEQYTHSPKADQLTEKFNGYIEGKVFILVEEVHMRGRMEVLDALKPLVTNIRMEIRGMAQEKRMAKNLANWGFCTNYKDAVMKSRGDRRYSVFFTAQQDVDHLTRDGMDGDYFPDMYRWLREEGGHAAVAHWLKTFPIDPALNPAGSCHRAPKTSSTAAAIAAATGSIEREVLEACDDHTVGFRGGWVSAWALDKLLREKHLKIGRARVEEMMTELGFKVWGRAPRPILQEESKCPTIYCRVPGGSFEDYMKAQAYFG